MSALVSPLELRSDGFIATLPESRGTDGFLTFMSFGYMILCSEPSVAVVKTALVHKDDPRSHRTARHRRDSVSPLEPQSDGFISTFPGGARYRRLIHLHDLQLHNSVLYTILWHHECRAGASGRPPQPPHGTRQARVGIPS